MEYQTSHITFPLSEGMQNRIFGNRARCIDFDKQDALRHFSTGNGWICEAQQDLDDKKEFLSQFFSLLMKKNEVRTCSTLMIVIEYSENKTLKIKDLSLITEYMANLSDKDLMWNVNSIQGADGLRIMAIAVL